MKTTILSLLVAVGLIGSASAVPFTGDLANGLVVYYPFNGDSNDYSGYSNNGRCIMLFRHRSSRGNASFVHDYLKIAEVMDGYLVVEEIADSRWDLSNLKEYLLLPTEEEEKSFRGLFMQPGGMRPISEDSQI